VAARVVNEDPAHDLRRNPEEVPVILPVDGVLFDEPEVCLVNERGGLQRVAPTFAAKLSKGDPTPFGVDERQQSIERISIAATPRFEQPRDVVVDGHRHPEGPKESIG
jgi:hypothetical protein